MEPLKAVVRGGRLVLDAPTDLPEGSVVELAVVVEDDGNQDARLIEELAASAEDEAAGYLIDFEVALSPLGSKQSTRGPR